jgi:hypothetical protein
MAVSAFGTVVDCALPPTAVFTSAVVIAAPTTPVIVGAPGVPVTATFTNCEPLSRSFTTLAT